MAGARRNRVDEYVAILAKLLQRDTKGTGRRPKLGLLGHPGGGYRTTENTHQQNGHASVRFCALLWCCGDRSPHCRNNLDQNFINGWSIGWGLVISEEFATDSPHMVFKLYLIWVPVPELDLTAGKVVAQRLSVYFSSISKLARKQWCSPIVRHP